MESNNTSKSAYLCLCCIYLKKELMIIILCVEAYGISWKSSLAKSSGGKN